MMEKKTTTGKAPNWTKAEQAVLTEECSKHAHILRAKFSNKVTQEDKNKVWKLVQEKVNALGNGRTLHQCYKKWQNNNSRAATEVRKFLKESKKTGKYALGFFLDVCESRSFSDLHSKHSKHRLISISCMLIT